MLLRRGKTVRKLLITLGMVIVSLLGLLAVLLFARPVTGVVGAVPHVFPVGNARIARGQALIRSDAKAGADVLQWHWCPSQGLSAWCFQLAGYSGYYRGVASVGLGYFQLDTLTFSRLHPARLGIANAEPNAVISGELAGARWSWGDRCLHSGLVHVQGELLFTSRGLGQRHIGVAGDNRRVVALHGDLVRGTLNLDGARVAGQLQLTLDGRPGAPTTGIEVSRTMFCGGGS